MPDVHDERGQGLTLGARLGRGGEGEVFEVVGQPGLVAKILHPKSRTQAKLDKVKAMLARPPAGAHDALEGLPVLTWPRSVLHAKATGQGGATFLGYTMTRIAPRDFVPFYQLTSAARRRSLGGTPITWDRLVLLAMRLCHVVRTLHRFGYAVGDLNDRNVLVSRRLTPLLMDTDSFQVPKGGASRKGHFPSIVGDQQYWAPELLAVDLATHTGDREPGDRFALGVLLFQLFMGGLRPYQARGSAVDGMESLAEKTQAGLYPWPSPKPAVLEPPASAPDYRALPRPIRQAFERCFVAGHAHPRKRPTADDWYAALAKVHATGYQTCKREARHVFAADQAACPWCADPNDPFDPSPKAGRAPRPVRPVAKTLPATPAATPSTPRRGRAKANGNRTPAQGTRAPVKKAGPPQRALPARPATSGAGPAAVAKPPAPVKARWRRRPRALKSASPAAASVPAPAKGKAANQGPDKAPKSKGKQRRGGGRARTTPLTDRWPVRGAWVGGLSLAFASPTLVLAAMPLGLELKATMAAATVLFLCAAGLAATWRWLRGRQAKAAGAWISLTVALAATLGLVGIGRWGWLVYTTGAACLMLGLAAFVWLERGRRGAFRPEGVGLVHGALGIPVAYVPVFVAWGWASLA